MQRAGGEVDGVVRPSGRQRGERGLVEQRQDAVLEPVPLVLQPGLERRAFFEGEALQEFAVEGAGVGVLPGAAGPPSHRSSTRPATPAAAGRRRPIPRRGSAAARRGSSAGHRGGPRRRGTGGPPSGPGRCRPVAARGRPAQPTPCGPGAAGVRCQRTRSWADRGAESKSRPYESCYAAGGGAGGAVGEGAAACGGGVPGRATGA